MKNLLVYVHPRKGFDMEHTALAKIQLDNCFRLGWGREGILMATNFPFEYDGFKSLEIPDSTHCSVKNQTSKIEAIIYLFEQGLIDDLCWFHDFDAYQLHPITEQELELGEADLGLTDYGWSSKWNTGSFFFNQKSLDIFQMIRGVVYELNVDEEESLMALTDANKINSRIKRLNVTYNLGMNKIDRNKKIATKPIKVLHFHPGKRDMMQRFKSLMPKGLVGVMNRHGYY